MIIDRFNRVIIDNGDGSYSAEGLLIEAADIESAIMTFDAMAPTELTSTDVIGDIDSTIPL